MNTAKLLEKRISYARVIVVSALAIQFFGWGIFGTFGIFINQFQSDLGWNRASISGVASVILLVHGFFSIIMGNISDRYGPRLVMTACAVLFALGIFLTSQISSLWQLYASWGVIAGIGVSALDVVVLSTIARWFDKRRGVVNGLVKAGAGVGHLTFPLIAGILIVNRDWRFAYVVLTIICLVAIVTAAQFLKRDPDDSTSRNISGKPLADHKAAQTEGGISFPAAVRLPQFWAVIAAYAGALFCTYTMQVHVAPHAINLGSSVTGAAVMLSIIGASSIVGRFAMGAVGDRIGNVRGMMICCIILTITLLSLGIFQQSWILYLILPVYGFGHGGIYSLISPMIAGLFGTGSHGAIYGVIIFGGTIGGALGPLLAGAIFDNTGNYSVVFFILSAAAVCGLALLATLKPVAARELQHG